MVWLTFTPIPVYCGARALRIAIALLFAISVAFSFVFFGGCFTLCRAMRLLVESGGEVVVEVGATNDLIQQLLAKRQEISMEMQRQRYLAANPPKKLTRKEKRAAKKATKAAAAGSSSGGGPGSPFISFDASDPNNGKRTVLTLLEEFRRRFRTPRWLPHFALNEPAIWQGAANFKGRAIEKVTEFDGGKILALCNDVVIVAEVSEDGVYFNSICNPSIRERTTCKMRTR